MGGMQFGILKNHHMETSRKNNSGKYRKIAGGSPAVDKGQFYIFGIHPVEEAVKSGRKIEKVYLKQGLEGESFRRLLDLLNEKNVPFQFVPYERLARLSASAHQGVVAVIPKIEYSDFDSVLEASSKEKNPVFVLLDSVTDVRNFGAIARTAECTGVSGIVVPAKGAAALNADAIKASAGALLRMNVSKVPNLRAAIYLLKQSGFKIVALTEKSDAEIYSVGMNCPIAFVMGSEGSGISRSVLDLCDEKAKIPMHGSIGSLNVSVASAVVLYEMYRQRIG